MSATVSTPKPCHGGAVTLAPIRMSDMVAGGNSTGMPLRSPGGYVPPSMRKTPSYSDTTPKTVASINSDSHQEFPTLGSTPKSVMNTSASWTQIRSRFHPETPPTPATPATPAVATPRAPNQFAALDEDAATASSTKGPVNFKKVIEDRIKREEAERLGLYEAEPTDPQKMTHEQLARNGWAALSLPPAEQGEARKAWFADFVARNAEKEVARKAREEMEELVGVTYTMSPNAPYSASYSHTCEDATEDSFSIGPEEDDVDRYDSE